jgi:hypothetical protein
MEREALKLALEALENVKNSIYITSEQEAVALEKVNQTIPAIKSALAQPAQEPVAWAVQGCSKMWREEFAEIDAKAEAKRIGGTCVAYALYISPPQRPWVGLTPEETSGFTQHEMTVVKYVSKVLQEKNI